MKSYIFAIPIIIAAVACSRDNTRYPERALGWELGAGSYCFQYFTFFEALDKIDSCDLKYVEGSPFHAIGGGIDGKLDYRMDASTREIVLEKLKEKGLKMNAYGVISPDKEEDWRRLFEFGKAMGIGTFASQPDPEFLPLISKLCEEYQINVTIHNHPAPSRYWSPDQVLAVLDGQSKRIGACADIGHWIRSGLDPVECLKKLEGHVLHLHMKDLNERSNKEAHDVRWGTGVANVKGILAELKRQEFKGPITAEYEYNWYNSVPDIKASVIYFREELNRL